MWFRARSHASYLAPHSTPTRKGAAAPPSFCSRADTTAKFTHRGIFFSKEDIIVGYLFPAFTRSFFVLRIVAIQNFRSQANLCGGDSTKFCGIFLSSVLTTKILGGVVLLSKKLFLSIFLWRKGGDESWMSQSVGNAARFATSGFPLRN